MSQQPPTGNGHCPYCGQPHAGPATSCGRCGIPLTGPTADALRQVTTRLARIDAVRLRLLGQRDTLLGQLLAQRQPSWAQPFAAPTETPTGGHRPGGSAATGRRRDAAPLSVQHLLLGLGALLLVVAALAFTLLNWGELGIGGRALVLAVATTALLLPPVWLLRRGLRSTAEALSTVGLLLVALDAYAIRHTLLPQPTPETYLAFASATVAALWAAYGHALRPRGLRGPLPAAVVLAQLPLPSAALALGGGTDGLLWALLLTALGDAVLVQRLSPGRRLRSTAVVCLVVVGGAQLLSQLALTLVAEHPGELPATVTALGVTALALLYQARRDPDLATPLAVTAGLCGIAAVGGTVRTLLPATQWWPAGYALSAAGWLALTTALAGTAGRTGRTSAPLDRHSANGLLLAGVGVQGLTLLAVFPTVTQGLLGPLGWAAQVWRGAPDTARQALTPEGGPTPATTPAALTLLVLALCAMLAARFAPTVRAAYPVALTLLVSALVLGPPALDLGYRPGALWLLVLSSGLWLTAAHWSRSPRLGPWTGPALLGCAALVTATTVGWSLADRSTNLLVLGALSAVTVAVAALSAPGLHRAVAATASVAVLAGALSTLGAATGFAPERYAFALLALSGLALGVAGRLREDAPTSLAVEGVGALVATVAVGLTLTDAATLSLALSLCGVLAAAQALRPERRTLAGPLSGALMVLALWARWYASDISTPEAYTLPVTVLGLAVGWLRRRQNPQLSSWVAFAPGLTATLLPSAALTWYDAGWQRPLLLGLCALALTLAGASLRLQAPLLLGAATLAVVGVHELAPYLAQVVDAMPRWVAPALGGALLLALGARYERRLSQARRLGERLRGLD
ncbi:hypothetical protein [Streptomyces sp. NPDC005438]|uniref:SCO7613 C-terminal domain-containing membrane protein n=1 Tax=Streptomyces sp. NPDC005438 TaxID=3156880 RepID=UPI0033BE3845